MPKGEQARRAQRIRNRRRGDDGFGKRAETQQRDIKVDATGRDRAANPKVAVQGGGERKVQPRRIGALPILRPGERGVQVVALARKMGKRARLFFSLQSRVFGFGNKEKILRTTAGRAFRSRGRW